MVDHSKKLNKNLLVVICNILYNLNVSSNKILFKYLYKSILSSIFYGIIIYMDIISFIKEKPYLFWYIKDLENLSNESIVEHVLNYSDFNDFKKNS